jgi:hypothetical protein
VKLVRANNRENRSIGVRWRLIEAIDVLGGDDVEVSLMDERREQSRDRLVLLQFPGRVQWS